MYSPSQSIMTPYLNTLSPLTTEILTASATKPAKDTELWRSVVAALTTSFQVDESGMSEVTMDWLNYQR
jgi:hypothetical protein